MKFSLMRIVLSWQDSEVLHLDFVFVFISIIWQTLITLFLFSSFFFSFPSDFRTSWELYNPD